MELYKSNFKPEFVDTSIVPTCFKCVDAQDDPDEIDYWTLKDFTSRIIFNDDVMQIEHQLMVANFSALQPPLLDGVANFMGCFISPTAVIAQRRILTLGKK